MAEILDVVELTVNLPKERLYAGMQGTVLELYSDDACEVEFTNELGETLHMLALRPEQYIVVWRTKTRTWVPIAERVAILASRLPEKAGQELLDFARFLNAHRQPATGEGQAAYATPSNLTTMREPNADPYGITGSQRLAPPDT